MAYEYKSNLNEVLKALEIAKKEACNEIGTLVTAEAQLREPRATGNMVRSTTYEVLEDNSGVDVGVTMDAPYSIWVHEGSSKNHNPQHFLLDAIMNNTSKIKEIIEEKIASNMGGGDS